MKATILSQLTDSFRFKTTQNPDSCSDLQLFEVEIQSYQNNKVCENAKHVVDTPIRHHIISQYVN